MLKIILSKYVMLQIHKSLLLRVLSDKNGKLSSRRLRRILSGKYPNILENLKNVYDDIQEEDFSINEVFYRLKRNIENRPVCPICGTPLKFIGIEYRKTCNRRECITKQSLNSMFETHGYYSSWSIKEVHQKCVDAIDYKARIEKYKKTCLEKFGGENYFSKESIGYQKTKDTLMSKYGVDHIRHIPGIEEKIKKTNQEKYGYDYGLSSKEIIKKREQTYQKRYGNSITNAFQVDWIKKKMKSTWIKKYGVDNPTKNPEILQKVFETSRRNKTHIGYTSKEEESLYLELSKVFDNIERFIRTKDYPFNCDFYIPEKNLYIEYQGYWTHGNHLFNLNNNNDQKLLEKIKSKNTKWYNIFVKTWCVLDPYKFDIAKNNDINFLSIYGYFPNHPNKNKCSIEEIIDMINSFDLNKHKQIRIGEYNL